jgi:hypothetical protein
LYTLSSKPYRPPVKAPRTEPQFLERMMSIEARCGGKMQTIRVRE